MQGVFADRGVTGCSDVVEASAPRPLYTIGSYRQTTLASGSLIPGPHQLLVRTPLGASAVAISATLAVGSPSLKLLARQGDAIKLTKLGTTLLSDAAAKVDVTAAGPALSATAAIDAPCAGALYVTLANVGAAAVTLKDLAVTVTPKPECAASADGGGMPPPDDGGVVDGGALGGPKIRGCGCGGAPWGLPAVPLLAWRLRRRRA
jgi:hypothetical protein